MLCCILFMYLCIAILPCVRINDDDDDDNPEHRTDSKMDFWQCHCGFLALKISDYWYDVILGY